MQLWDIEPHPELSLKGRLQNDEHGRALWVVVGKREWQFDGINWNPLQECDIFTEPQYMGEPGASAQRIDHEFAYFKSNTDVILCGKARSYAKNPVTSHECRLLIDGHIDKTLKVYGPRQWVEHGGSITISRPSSFIEADIDYSYAIGGDERNRMGCGVATSNQQLLEQPVPRIFYPNEDWTATSKQIKVAGFGSVPPFFESRQRLAGTFDDEWLENRKPTLPVDFDRRFYQTAPLDQQCKGHLSGGERIMMSGFCHDDTLTFRLPKTRYQAEARFKDQTITADMSIFTLFVDTETKKLSLTYTAAFPCQDQEHLLISTVITNTQEA